MSPDARTSFWRERRPEIAAGIAGVFLSILWSNRSLPFQGWGVVGVVTIAAALLFTLRRRLRLAYAVLELFVAAALAWHATTSLQAAASVYVAVRGLDNWVAGVGDLRRTPTWEPLTLAWGRLMYGVHYRPPTSPASSEGISPGSPSGDRERS